MDAIVTAGGIPKPEDPLYEHTRGESKAMLDIAGKPMIQWVLDAINQAASVDNVVIVGLEEDQRVTCEKPLFFVPNQGGMLDNARAGIDKVAEINPQAELVVMVSSDIPAIRAEMIDWLVDTALETEHDIYYAVIKRDLMESRFPGSNRSYTKLKDMEVCGADMNIVRCSAAAGNDELWNRLIAARKNVLRQAALVGFGTLFLLIIGQLSLDSAVPRASKSLGLRGRAIVSPYAEIGMDVDKPSQLEILRADLTRKATP